MFGGFLFYTVSSIKSPNIVASLEILDLNQDEIVIQIKIDIENPNFFSLTIQNFNIKCMNETNFTFGTMNLIGGKIKGFSNSTYISNGSFSFEKYEFEPLINEISGEIGFNFYGIIDKKVPINIKLIAYPDDIILNINPPEITINAEISEVTNEGISIIGDIDIFNPNNFKIMLDDVSLDVISELDEIVGYFDIESDEIEPNSYKNFSINGNLKYNTLNYDLVIINFRSKAGISIAGFEKIINLSSSTKFKIPNIQEILLIDDTMDFSISGEFKLRSNGVLTKVGFKIYNPSEIPINATDLVCYISRFDNNKTTTLVQNNMETCIIPSKNEVCITTNLTIPYLSLISFENNKFLPEWFVITIEGNFSIEGTNQKIPLSFNGYISPHFVI